MPNPPDPPKPDSKTPQKANDKRKSHSPSDSNYDLVLQSNYIEIDSTGYKMSEEIREMVDKIILEEKSFNQLSKEQLRQTVLELDNRGSPEAAVEAAFLKRIIFPRQRAGLGFGGKTPWSTSTLAVPASPFDPKVSTPMPDHHIGYKLQADKQTGFTANHAKVFCTGRVTEYIKPAAGNGLPFLIFEFKSEATGGALHRAEHQIAGSGTIAVASMRWLLEEANIGEENINEKDIGESNKGSMSLDSAAFSMTASGRTAELWVHWYCPDDKLYYMSKIRSFSTTSEKDIQACHNAVNNIVDWAMGTRFTMIKTNLDKLYSRITSGALDISPLGLEMGLLEVPTTAGHLVSPSLAVRPRDITSSALPNDEPIAEAEILIISDPQIIAEIKARQEARQNAKTQSQTVPSDQDLNQFRRSPRLKALKMSQVKTEIVEISCSSN